MSTNKECKLYQVGWNWKFDWRRWKMNQVDQLMVLLKNKEMDMAGVREKGR